MFIKHLKCVHWCCCVPFNDAVFAFAYLLTKYRIVVFFCNMNFYTLALYLCDCWFLHVSPPLSRIVVNVLTIIFFFVLFRFIKNSYVLNSENEMLAHRMTEDVLVFAHSDSFHQISNDEYRFSAVPFSPLLFHSARSRQLFSHGFIQFICIWFAFIDVMQ